jgi:hypothetical protein
MREEMVRFFLLFRSKSHELKIDLIKIIFF